ncbi:serine protein kinase RIO [Thermoplasmatales archaeon ex4572_165]|nr:MAG: serine protein kinase RIO [Thermoplasmatales archaeon ex4572_165]
MSSEETFLTKKQNKIIDDAIQKIFSREGVDRKTLDEVFDISTLLSIEKLISNRIIDYLDFPISSGKEGNVFLGITPDNKTVALKIYRISTATFKHMTQYLEGDPRFQTMHKSRRDIIFNWTSKEYKNLQILERIGVNAPRPIKKINNVLVMDFIGQDRQPAPLIKDIQLPEPEKIFKTIINTISTMYLKAELVHCDLSPFNILYHNNEPCIIDLGQGVLRDHPRSYEFLKRDIQNIISYFKKYQIHEDPHKIYQEITGKKW